MKTESEQYPGLKYGLEDMPSFRLDWESMISLLKVMLTILERIKEGKL